MLGDGQTGGSQSLPRLRKAQHLNFPYVCEAVLLLQTHPQTFPCDPDIGISCVLLLPLLAWPVFSKIMS